MALTSILGTLESTLLGSSMAAGFGLTDPLSPSVTHELGLQHTVGAWEEVSHTMVLVQGVFIELLINDFEGVSHALGLTDEAEPGTIQDVQQSLGLTDLAEAVVFGPISHNLGLNGTAQFVGPTPASASNTLALTDLAVAMFDVPVSVAQSLGITDEAQDVQKHELNLTHNAFGYLNASPHFEDVLGVTHAVVNNIEYVVDLAHTSVVTQAVAFYIDDGTNCPKNEFNDYNTLGVLPFTVAAGAKLSFKGITGTQEIVFLRNPEIDDRDRLGFTRINRESRGGELQVYRDPTWPEVNTLQGTVIGLKKTDSDAFLQFLEDHLGEEISLNDWHGRYWRGVIVNPGEAVVEDTRNRWTVAFEFEGVEMPGPDLIQASGITHSWVHNVDYTRSLTDPLGIGHTVVVETNQVLHNTDSVFYIGQTVIYSGPP